MWEILLQGDILSMGGAALTLIKPHFCLEKVVQSHPAFCRMTDFFGHHHKEKICRKHPQPDHEFLCIRGKTDHVWNLGSMERLWTRTTGSTIHTYTQYELCPDSHYLCGQVQYHPMWKQRCSNQNGRQLMRLETLASLLQQWSQLPPVLEMKAAKKKNSQFGTLTKCELITMIINQNLLPPM